MATRSMKTRSSEAKVGGITATSENGSASEEGVSKNGAARNGSPKRKAVTAESMAASQRDISVSEFFAKNRHLLGFDNPRKALLTTVKEAVDNSLDACEEASILPEIWVHIESTGNNRYKIGIQDNGPGIMKKQIPLIFGKLLYGSKFHRLRMSRGQQGIPLVSINTDAVAIEIYRIGDRNLASALQNGDVDRQLSTWDVDAIVSNQLTVLNAL